MVHYEYAHELRYGSTSPLECPVPEKPPYESGNPSLPTTFESVLVKLKLFSEVSCSFTLKNITENREIDSGTFQYSFEKDYEIFEDDEGDVYEARLYGATSPWIWLKIRTKFSY